MRKRAALGRLSRPPAGGALAAVVAVMACGPCEQQGATGPLEDPSPRPSQPSAPARRAVATRASFDLVSTGQGAVLLWGVPGRDGAGLRAAVLDAVGVARHPEPTVIEAEAAGGGGGGSHVPSQAVEVAAGAGGGRLGVAWVQGEGPDALRAFATHGKVDASAFGPPVDLGATEAGPLGERGRVAVAVSDAGLVDVLYRSTRGPCRGEHPGEQCARFHHWQPDDERRGIPLVVPRPCGNGIVGSLFRATHWYFGLCAQEEGGRAVTTYALQFEPEYAHAERMLPGCVPTGFGPTPAGVLVVGRCDGKVHAHELAEAGMARTGFGAVERRASCREGRPVLVVEGEGGRRELPLGRPLDGLEAWLADRIAPPGSRAVWTGEALLVAVPIEGEVTIRRHQCDNQRLARTDHP